MDRRTQRVVFIILLFGVSVVLYRSLGSQHGAVRHITNGSPPRPSPLPPLVGTGNMGGSDFSLDLSGLEPANATLGFGAVVAVSRPGSPRRDGLLLAANITEIDITIPSQPQWTEDDVNSIRADRDSRISRGSALAWLGHLNALRWFLSTNLESILIMEDDVDWDIHLRTSQIPTAAAAIRKLVSEKTYPFGSSEYIPEEGNYWGNSSTWDILYLGHCGDIFRTSSWTSSTPRIMYEDKTLPPRRQLHPYTQKFLESIGIPEDTRVIHQSIFPLCTFGFAVTRDAAYQLLTEIAPKEAEGGTMAYDVRILEGCRDHGLQCWSANPELFHHMDMESEIAAVNDAPLGEGEGDKAGADEKGRLKTLRQGAAPNIACGARSKDFITADPKAIEYLTEVVGRQGRCLKDPDSSDKSLRDGPALWDDPRLNGNDV